MILLRDIYCCVSHVCFRNHYFINLIAHTLRAGGCQFDNFVVAGGTVSYHYDNFRCHQWWRGCRADDLLFSEYDIALYILALFICRILAFWLMLFVVHTTLNKFYLILSYLTVFSVTYITYRKLQDTRNYSKEDSLARCNNQTAHHYKIVSLMINMILSKKKTLCIFHNARDTAISTISHNKISYYYHQGVIAHEDIKVGTHEDTRIPEHLM